MYQLCDIDICCFKTHMISFLTNQQMKQEELASMLMKFQHKRAAVFWTSLFRSPWRGEILISTTARLHLPLFIICVWASIQRSILFGLLAVRFDVLFDTSGWYVLLYQGRMANTHPIQTNICPWLTDSVGTQWRCALASRLSTSNL